MGNEGQMEQVWTNLIHNAIQAMDYSGTLTISVTKEYENAIIEIKDTGSGIPSDIQSEIFKPFYTTKPKGEGSGLGLDIVYKILKAHNGEITFSTNSDGTVFTVILPLINHQNNLNFEIDDEIHRSN